VEPQIEEQKVDYRPLGISGLGGWLILVHIGLYLTIIMLVVQLFQYLVPSLTTETWKLLTSKQSDYYHAWWGPVLIFETVYNVLFLIFSVYTLITFYRKKSIFPRLMIMFYSVSLAVGIIDYLLLLQIPMAVELEDGSSLKGIGRSVLTCAIWIPYFIKSVRVHNTFVR
jgi:magnesium-transporting ATPase (P-type)